MQVEQQISQHLPSWMDEPSKTKGQVKRTLPWGGWVCDSGQHGPAKMRYKTEPRPSGSELSLDDRTHVWTSSFLKVKILKIAARRHHPSLSLAIAYTHGNRLIHICDTLILDLAGVDKNGRIGGCGMDMLFAAQYNLFHSLHGSYKRAHYQKRMARYNSL